MTQCGVQCKNAGVNLRDFTTDESMAFLHLLKEANALPDWLESAPESEEVKHLPDFAFADTHRRMMPIFTKSAAYLSAVSAGVYGYPSESNWETRLKAACHSFGITDLVKQAHEVLAPISEKQASSEPVIEKRAYALHLQIEPEGEPTPFYPINHADEIEDSALKLAADMHQQKLPGTWFVEAAENLLKAAAEHGLDEKRIPAEVRRLGEERVVSPEYLDEQIQRRSKQASLPEEVVEIYKEAALNALDDAKSAMDAAHVWELADRKFGIRYTDTVVQPAVAFKSGMKKAQFDKLAGCYVTLGGVTIPFNALTTIPDTTYAAVLPEKAAAAALQAKAASDGLQATARLAEVDERHQLQILELVVEGAG